MNRMNYWNSLIESTIRVSKRNNNKPKQIQLILLLWFNPILYSRTKIQIHLKRSIHWHLHPKMRQKHPLIRSSLKWWIMLLLLYLLSLLVCIIQNYTILRGWNSGSIFKSSHSLWYESCISFSTFFIARWFMASIFLHHHKLLFKKLCFNHITIWSWITTAIQAILFPRWSEISNI